MSTYKSAKHVFFSQPLFQPIKQNSLYVENFSYVLSAFVLMHLYFVHVYGTAKRL
jgi:hypothetical protein